MRSALSCLLLFGVLLPARAQDNPPDEPAPDDSDPNAKVMLTLDPGHHLGPIHELLFTPDDKRLVSVGEDRTIQVWDAASGERLRVFRPPVGAARGGAVVAAALSPDGNTLACGAVGVVFEAGKPGVNFLYLLNLHDGRLLPVPNAGTRVHALAFSADGDRLAAAHLPEAPAPADAPGRPPAAGQGAVVDVYRGLKGVWGRKRPSFEPWKSFAAGGDHAQLAFSPKGARLAACTPGDQTIRVWDLDRAGNAPVAEWSDKESRPESLAWSPDGTRLVSGHRAEERTARALCVWSADGKSLRQYSRGDLVRAGVSPSKVLQIARVFFRPGHDRGGQELLLLYRNAVGTRSAALFDLKSGRGAPMGSAGGYSRGQTAGALAPDGTLAALAAAPEGRRIALFKVEANARARYLQGDEPVENRVGWLKDGHTIAWTGLGQASATALDLKRLERLTTSSDPLPPAVHRRDDGWKVDKVGDHLELSGGGRTVTTEAARGIDSYTLPAAGAVAWVAWTDLRGLHLSDADGKTVRHFRPAALPMRSLVSSPDGKYLLVYSIRGVFHVYDPGQETPLLTVFVSGPDWVVWTPEGYYAATPGGEKLMGWTVNNGPDPLASFYPAERFRQALYRPDVIRLVLEEGSVEKALKAVEATAVKVETLLPPKATLDRLDGPELPRVKMKATAAAAAPGQLVTSLQLLVDGRPLPDGGGTLKLKVAQLKAETTWEADLPPGHHDLKVLARGPNTAGASAAVPVEVPTPAGADRPTLHVIAVGIDDYPEKALQLKCAVADANELAKAFREDCAGQDNLFGAAKVEPLLNEKATRAAVLAALKEVRGAVKPGDLLVFSFAGHGARQGKQFYLLTYDADPTKLAETALSGEDLRAALADLPCQVLLLLDACHSAAGVRAFIDQAARGLTGDETGVAVLCAAMGYEEAQEKDGHGLFTRAVIEALGRSDRVPYNYRDGRQYVHHLGAFVLDDVQAASHDAQHPFLALPYVTESFPVRQLPGAPAAGR